MIAKRLLGVFIIFTFFVQIASSQDNRVMCEVTENKKSVSVAFGDDVKYLGTDYTKQIGLYDDKNQLKFDTAIDVVSYLCSHWGDAHVVVVGATAVVVAACIVGAEHDLVHRLAQAACPLTLQLQRPVQGS